MTEEPVPGFLIDNQDELASLITRLSDDYAINDASTSIERLLEMASGNSKHQQELTKQDAIRLLDSLQNVCDKIA
jgi:hypothetical protein